MTTHRFRLHAHNFQFVLLDEGSDDSILPAWDDDARERMLDLLPNSAWIGTLRDDAVVVRLHVLDAPPEIDLDRVEHAATGSFEVPTGRLVVMGSSDPLPSAQRVEVTAGCQRILVTLAGVDAGPADEHYAIHLWPGTAIEPQLLKHW